MIIGIPVYDQVDLLDVTGPYEMFRWAKFEIELVAERPGLVSFRDSFSFQVMKGFSMPPPMMCCGCRAAIRPRSLS